MKEEIERRRAEAAEKRQKVEDTMDGEGRPFKCVSPRGSSLKVSPPFITSHLCPCRRHDNKETALFFYCILELVIPIIISLVRKNVRSDCFNVTQCGCRTPPNPQKRSGQSCYPASTQWGNTAYYLHSVQHSRQHNGVNLILLQNLQIPLIRRGSKAQAKHPKYLERLSAR